jgi:curved DNA-binding protein CbpA/ketosteroid isomerase-like protein
MKDYYKILGVEEEASEQEIRARWIELTKHSHPDLGKTEEGDEKIKEINEAYEILKNEATRYHYDFERDLRRSFFKRAHRRQERRMNIQKIIIPSGILVLFLIVGFILFRRVEVAPPLRTEAKTEALKKIDEVSEKKTASQIPPVKTDSKAQDESEAPEEIEKEVMPPESEKTVSLSPRRSPSGVERESERKKEPPREILPESKVKLTPQVVMKSEIPALKEVSKGVPKQIPKQVAKEVPKELPKEVAKAVSREVPKEVSKEVPKEVPKQVAKEVPKELPREVLKEVPKEVPKEIPKQVAKEVPKELPKEVPKEVLKEVPKEVSKEVSREIPKEVAKEVSKEVPKEVPKELPKETPKEIIRVTLHPGEKLTIGTKEEKTGAFSRSLLAKEEEVEQFFSNYVDRYNRKDVGGFLSFFSSKAIQNQTDGLEAIGNLYTKFINQSGELRYQIEGMKIEIFQNRVDVKARFRVDHKLKKDGEEKVWKGNIRWVLVKEEGRLKISSLDYQNEKSP